MAKETFVQVTLHPNDAGTYSVFKFSDATFVEQEDDSLVILRGEKELAIFRTDTWAHVVVLDGKSHE